MGFFGLKHWGESDEAADFRYTLLRALATKRKKDRTLVVRKCVSSELDNMANCYNTPGFINLALCLEVEGQDGGNEEYAMDCPDGLPVFSDLLTATQLRKAEKLFSKHLKEWDPDFTDRLRELHVVVYRKLRGLVTKRKTK